MNKRGVSSLISTLLIVIFILLIVSIVATLHTFEANAHVRCDGKSVFPIAKEDKVVEGKIKLDNIILVNVFNLGIRLYEPISEGGTFILFQKGCIYQRVGRWYPR